MMRDPQLPVGSEPGCIQRREGQEETPSLGGSWPGAGSHRCEGGNEEHHSVCQELISAARLRIIISSTERWSWRTFTK